MLIIQASRLGVKIVSEGPKMVEYSRQLAVLHDLTFSHLLISPPDHVRGFRKTLMNVLVSGDLGCEIVCNLLRNSNNN